jgi:Icc-related predicted phosphoesterase
MLTIVCISDTHGYHDHVLVPPGDLLIHAGDMTRRGTLPQVQAFNSWLGTLPHPHKIVIAGNHDWYFEREPEAARKAITNATYLLDETAEVGGLRIYGSPWQPRFHDWAFNVDRGPQLAEKWAMIPPNTDILVTHGPPFGIADETFVGDHVGCVDLLARVRVVRPKLHIFGHIHEAAGMVDDGETLFVNASAVDTGRAFVFTWDGERISPSSTPQ